MIPLLSTSQEKYVIGTDTCTCYTPDQNRAIAIVMIEGERDSALLYNCENQNRLLVKEIITYKGKEELYKKQVQELAKAYENVFIVAENTKDKLHTANRNFKLASGLSLLLTLILVL